MRYAAKLQRSATAPEMIVAAVAANTNWKNQWDKWSSGKPIESQYVRPTYGLPVPYAMAYPNK